MKFYSVRRLTHFVFSFRCRLLSELRRLVLCKRAVMCNVPAVVEDWDVELLRQYYHRILVLVKRELEHVDPLHRQINKQMTR